MHASSRAHMARLVDERVGDRNDLLVAEIGSRDVNGSYRELFGAPGWTYVGMDVEPGPNVDRIVHEFYRLPGRTGEFDLVVSGQAFEHIEFFWITMMEINRILKPGGELFLIAPSRGKEHRHPVDCWRFYPDGYHALARWAGMTCVSATTDWPDPQDPKQTTQWGDTVGVFRRGRRGFLRMLGEAIFNRAARRIAARGAD